MRDDARDDVREYLRVLQDYLDGNGSLDAALTAWRAVPIEESEGEEADLEEDALLGFDREALHPAQQARLDAFLQALER